MASKSPDAPTEKQPKGPKIMRLMQVTCFAIGLMTAVTLFVGAYDFGFFDGRMMISKVAIAVIPFFILSVVLWNFAQSRVTAAAQVAQEESLAAIYQDIDLKIKAAQEKFDEYLGDEFKTLKSENQSMKDEFESMKAAEREKLEQENSFLREQNSLLKEKINTRPIGGEAKANDGDQLSVVGDPTGIAQQS